MTIKIILDQLDEIDKKIKDLQTSKTSLINNTIDTEKLTYEDKIELINKNRNTQQLETDSNKCPELLQTLLNLFLRKEVLFNLNVLDTNIIDLLEYSMPNFVWKNILHHLEDFETFDSYIYYNVDNKQYSIYELRALLDDFIEKKTFDIKVWL